MKFATILGMIGAALAVTATSEAPVKYVDPSMYLDQASKIMHDIKMKA